MGGIAGPGPVSELKPCAPPRVLSSRQLLGGTQSYGPVIFTPVFPLTSVGFSVADDSNGFGQSSSFTISMYFFSTSATGGLSLPFIQLKTDGWPRSRRIWSRNDAAAMEWSSSFQLAHFSQ